MTEKRFVRGYHTIRDKEKNKIYDFRIENVLCLLNTLHEENKLLKDIITDIVIQLDANHTSNTYQITIPVNKVIFNELNRRLTETSFNEDLRRFLDD